MIRTVIVFCMLLAAGAAHAAQNDDFAICASDTAAPDELIAACNRAINSGRQRGRNLALVYYNRGVAYGQKGDLDRAIADYGEAIRVDKTYPSAYTNLCNTWNDKGDVERAMPYCDDAIRLNPKDVHSFNNRCRAYLSKEDFDQRDGRLQRGDPRRRQVRPRLEQPRQHLAAQGRTGPRDRRLRRGARASIRNTPSPTTTADWSGRKRATPTAPSQT